MISECSKEILDEFIENLRKDNIAKFTISSMDNSYYIDYVPIDSDLLTSEEINMFNSNTGFLQKKTRAFHLVKTFAEKLEQNNVSSFDIEYDATRSGINLRASYCFLDKETDIKKNVPKEPTLEECLNRLRELNPKGKTGLYFKSYGKQKKYTEASALDVINVLENLF